jgi:hypothetical protein
MTKKKPPEPQEPKKPKMKKPETAKPKKEKKTKQPTLNVEFKIKNKTYLITNDNLNYILKEGKNVSYYTRIEQLLIALQSLLPHNSVAGTMTMFMNDIMEASKMVKMISNHIRKTNTTELIEFSEARTELEQQEKGDIDDIS